MIAFLLVGIFLIALVLTMVGLGGGLVFSPLFLLLGLGKTQAATAALFLNLLAAASAAYTYARNKMVDFSLSIPLIVSSSIAAPVGSLLNNRIEPKPFMIIMAAVLALAGIRMWIAPATDAPSSQPGQLTKITGGIGIGSSVGFIGGLLGIGGGVFVVPLLIYVLKIPTKTAAASSTFIVCFSSLTGFLGYASMSGVDWRFILPAAAASFSGGLVGARIMSRRLKGRTIHYIFSLILFALCAKLIYQSIIAMP